MHVSVVMAVYNGEQHVAEAIESVLGQTHTDLRLIVVDDGSTDTTASVVGGFTDDRVTLIRQPNGGVAPARNKGIREARGEAVAFIDHDDVWFPEKIEQQLAVLAAGMAGVVGSKMQYLSDRGPLRSQTGEDVTGQTQRIRSGRLMPFPLSSILIRIDLLRELGGFDERLSTIAQVEDLDLLMRASRVSTIATVPRPLGYYRIHDSAASFRTFHTMRRGTRYLRDRYAMEQRGRQLSWEEWSGTYRATRKQLREDRANFHYRTAGFKLAGRDRLAGIRSLSIAFASSPSYVVRRLRRQLRHG